MAEPFVMPLNSQPVLDARGYVTRPWYLFFQAVFRRIGGATGTGNVVLDALISDLQTQAAMQPDGMAYTKTLFDGLRKELVDFETAQAVVDATQNQRLNDLEVLGAFA